MLKASIVVEPFYQNNRLFDLDDKVVNRDNCMHPFWLLKQELASKGIILATNDITTPTQADIVIYNEMPRTVPKGEDIQKSYLMLFETELIRPNNWNEEYHNHFKKIFTWNDQFVDGKKYIKFQFASKLPTEAIIGNERPKFCTQIAGNKSSTHRYELYSKRLEAIRWFEKNYPDHFDYYGMGHIFYNFGSNKIAKLFNKLKVKKAPSPCYKGIVDEKLAVLSQYRFSICYENAQMIPGYITEKIFDSMFAGCVPIYWGAPNITDYIPANCFIDKRDFDSYEALYKYLKNMDAAQYSSYQQDINTFIKGEQIKAFSSEAFAATIAENIGEHIT
ncbi:MAG: hypothetical protein ISR65_03915 [Bacteriovoracaceae bacterium]|nr:hypothetical protein [Bacteriovoracaceae bacterium]